jgi:hypothetical protein
MKDVYQPLLEQLENGEKQTNNPLMEELISGKLATGELTKIFNATKMWLNCSLTPAGRDRLTENRKPYLQKVFEKQPATFLQIILSIFVSAMTSYIINYWPNILKIIR